MQILFILIKAVAKSFIIKYQDLILIRVCHLKIHQISCLISVCVNEKLGLETLFCSHRCFPLIF
jgi:hypothetical protein